MDVALHEPNVGYYATRPLPLGSQGDYYTSAELHPAFAAMIGRQVEQLWDSLGRPAKFSVQEAGPGSGLFARDLLDWARLANPPIYAALDYRLDEKSPALRSHQQRLLAHAGHPDRARWVEGFEDGDSVQLILANELLDALPTHLVQFSDGVVSELYVETKETADRRQGTGETGPGSGLVLEPGPPSTREIGAYFERLTEQGLLEALPAEGARAEVNLAALEWMRSAAQALDGHGLLLVLDYGYPARHLYGPSHSAGTLLCYYRHSVNSEPLRRVGQQDMTTHVDFDSIRLAGEEAGLRTLGLMSQRRLLGNLGWTSLRESIMRSSLNPAGAHYSSDGSEAPPPMRAVERDANLRALDSLVDPEGLGRILTLFQARGLPKFEPLGLVGGQAPGWPRPPLRTPEHMLLPDIADAEGLPDFESQWAELWTETTPG